jgi:hypothetical protein
MKRFNSYLYVFILISNNITNITTQGSWINAHSNSPFQIWKPPPFFENTYKKFYNWTASKCIQTASSLALLLSTSSSANLLLSPPVLSNVALWVSTAAALRCATELALTTAGDVGVAQGLQNAIYASNKPDDTVYHPGDHIICVAQAKTITITGGVAPGKVEVVAMFLLP